MNNQFVSDDLQSFIRKNVGRYVFSRARLEQFRTRGDLESIGLEAMTIMANNGTPGQKDTGNALGEILLYAFLEQILDAPKIMSKVELVTTTNAHSSKCDGIHLLSLEGYQQPYYQLVFVSSSVVGGIKDAIKYPTIQYQSVLNAKMNTDIKNHAAYIAQQIGSRSLGTHSFYFYILPLNHTDTDKTEIMERLMRGGVSH